ncbi:MAG: phenol hydroxylase [Gammaproteobacteria bacterium]|nr:phenol hydroxylase [Gammaproteobacteria bacterium]
MPSKHLIGLNQATRYVRITDDTRNGFVEFQFAIGDPTLYLEMILPRAAFEEFCVTNKAVRLNAEQGSMVDRDRRKWWDGQIDEEPAP